MNDPGLLDKILALHAALADADVPHAFGGALALAWCVGEVRATVDVDCNIFLEPAAGTRTALPALPDDVAWTSQDVAVLERDGQTRLWWGRHPIDLFFDTTEFHEEAAGRVQWRPLAGVDLPFLACADLAVFKVFLDRGQDWVDLESMAARRTTQWARTLGVLVSHLGSTDPRIAKLERLLEDAT